MLPRRNLAKLLSNKLAHFVQRLAHGIKLACCDEQQVAVTCAARGQLAMGESATAGTVQAGQPATHQRLLSAFQRLFYSFAGI